MKVIFIQCRIQPGGATQVLKDIVQHTKYTTASIYTLISSEKYLQIENKKIKIYTIIPGRLNNIFVSTEKKRRKKIFDYRYLLVGAPFFMRLISKKIQKQKPDKIVISSFAIAKNITVPHTSKILYLHSPMQYIRTHAKEYREKLHGLQGYIRKLLVPYLQKRDKKYTRFNKVYSNSHYTAQKAKEIYGIASKVLYPRIDSIFYEQAINIAPQAYYLYIGRLVRFVKELDRIIQANNILGFPLIIIGSGPDEEYLKALAHDNIIFIPRTTTDQYINILRNAKGLINITKESFGIVTAQAIALGVPVLGYQEGASTELINDTNGVLIKDKNIQTIVHERRFFNQKSFDRQAIHNAAKKNKNSTFVEF